MFVPPQRSHRWELLISTILPSKGYPTPFVRFTNREFLYTPPVSDIRENAFGSYIYDVRRQKGWALREAASRIGIAHSRLDEYEKGHNWHSGKTFKPSYQTVVRIAKAYELPVDELLRLAGHEPGAELTDEEQALVNNFRALSGEGRTRALAFLQELRGEKS